MCARFVKGDNFFFKFQDAFFIFQDYSKMKELSPEEKIISFENKPLLTRKTNSFDSCLLCKCPLLLKGKCFLWEQFLSKSSLSLVRGWNFTEMIQQWHIISAIDNIEYCG